MASSAAQHASKQWTHVGKRKSTAVVHLIWMQLFLMTLMLCHAAAEIAEHDHAATADRTAALTGAPTTGTDEYRNMKKVKSYAYKQLYWLLGASGTPVRGQFIVIYKVGIDALSAAARSRNSLAAYQQQQATAAAGAGLASAAAAAGGSTIALIAVLESHASSIFGAAVIQVPWDWELATVRAALDGPEVLAVVQDRYVTLASAAQPNLKHQLLVADRRQLQQQPDAHNVVITAATSNETGAMPDNAITLQALNCAGHFTDWTQCSLQHAPMYQVCTKLRTFVIDTPAANGGKQCQWGDGRVQWRRCAAEACGANAPAPGGSPTPQPSPSPSPNPKCSLSPSPSPSPRPRPSPRPHAPSPQPAPPNPYPSPPPMPASPPPRPRPKRSPMHPSTSPSPEPQRSPSPPIFPSPSPPRPSNPKRSPKPQISPSPAPLPSCSPRPSSPPAAGPVPVVAVPGEAAAPWGMVRTGAFSLAARTVADVSKLLTGPNRNMFVAVVDTGIDESHPDLVVAGIVDYADLPGSLYYKKDGHGHGTHVAGIIGARWSNASGDGTVGVVPGMPIYAFKALDAAGVGTISNVLRALADILNLLKQGRKIAAVNLSIAVSTKDREPPSREELNFICSYIEGISAYGTAVVAAAGNSNGQNVQWFYPAACPSAMAVTALNEYDFPAAFSNAALPTAPSKVLSHMMAAPGVNILSTYPLAGGMMPGQYSYTSISGTSQAAPFVAGGFTLCVLSGQCRLSKAECKVPAVVDNFPVLLDAAKQKPCGKFSDVCGPSWLIGIDKAYYGYMLDVSTFRQP